MRDDAALADEVNALAGRLSKGPTRGFARAKSLIRGSGLKSLSDELDLECDAMRELGFSKDYQEGVVAFFDKRAPAFIGR